MEDVAVSMTLAGHVQGVGFRPFVYRLAHQHGVCGDVRNRMGEVEILACASAAALIDFERDLIDRAPPLSSPRIVRRQLVTAKAPPGFEIAPSDASDSPDIFVPADFFLCEDCRRELGDPGDRRYRYPFINCTQCGPRYTLIESLPYDRPNTSMAAFPLCAACDAEYRNPLDRRFHAEPVACAECGPTLEFDGVVGNEAALRGAVAALNDGRIVAVKGIGGYHLLCDAANEAAVARLRARKRRPHKPLAVMFPLAGGDGLATLQRHANPDDAEARALVSPVRPIVLVRARPDSGLAANVAPGLDTIGAFLPYSPLHQLLLDDFGAPLVATSGNISGEPVLTDAQEAQDRLADVADAFLHHDRRIVRPADDSVYRRVGASVRPMRLGRGAAPLEIDLDDELACPTLAVGAHMKGAIALGWGNRAVVSPHIGEMDNPRSLRVLEQLAADLQALYGVIATRTVCDAHPGYTTHRWAQQQSAGNAHTVWHHEAHASALVAERGLDNDAIVFTWDGVGLGADGTLWGGEAFVGRPGRWRRMASLRPFRLPGGDRAGREPWRSAAALCWETGADYAGGPAGTTLAREAWRAQLNCPQTSAVGRLFDAAAAFVIGLDETSYEAQGPMALEALCRAGAEAVRVPLVQDDDGTWRSDWAPLLPILRDASLPPRLRAEVFHASLAALLLAQAEQLRALTGIGDVGLCGGVFQNRVLAELAVGQLAAAGFHAHLPRRLPANDAAIAFGQLAELGARDRGT